MHYLQRFAWVLLVTCVAGRIVQAAEEEKFQPLFNGRDLNGWVNVNCHPETFTVANGMIHCDGVPTGALRTTRQYENFIFELDWRHLKPGGNSGIFIWASPLPAVGQPFLRAIEVQVLDNAYGQSEYHSTHGDVFPIHGSTMKPFPPNRGDRSFPKESRSHSSPEWNHYRIVATNGVLRLSVNGVEVSGGTNCHWRKGFIALESEGGTVDFRNLRIYELPSSTVPAEEAAPAAESWRSLYDGRTLKGWNTPAAPTAVWSPQDWTLKSTASTAADAVLWSMEKLGDGQMFFDWRWEEKTTDRTPPLLLRFDERAGVVGVPEMPTAKGDGWNRLELRRRGSAVEFILNGQPAGMLTVPTEKCGFGLKPGTVPIAFSSIFIK